MHSSENEFSSTLFLFTVKFELILCISTDNNSPLVNVLVKTGHKFWVRTIFPDMEIWGYALYFKIEEVKQKITAVNPAYFNATQHDTLVLKAKEHLLCWIPSAAIHAS